MFMQAALIKFCSTQKERMRRVGGVARMGFSGRGHWRGQWKIKGANIHVSMDKAFEEQNREKGRRQYKYT